MTDFRFEKLQDKQDSSFIVMKQKLEIIMETLQKQKEEFVKGYEKQIRFYQQQIRIKDSIIESLYAKQEKNSLKLSQMTTQSQHYLCLIDNLKEQIFKMASVVNNIHNFTQKHELKRVKSDYINNPFIKVDIMKEKEKPLSSNTKKFDINNYFQNVKAKNPLKKQQISTQLYDEIEDNLSSAETIKIKSQVFGSQVLRVLKDNNERFKRTLKWGQLKNVKFQQHNYKIKDLKQNLWQQTC